MGANPIWQATVRLHQGISQAKPMSPISTDTSDTLKMNQGTMSMKSFT